MHFFALVKDGKTTAIRKLRVNQSLQHSLADLFGQQESAFLPDGIDAVDFDASYNVDESEVFSIPNCVVPQQMLDAVRTPRQVDELVVSSANPPQIKSIFAGEHDADGNTLKMLFQGFNKSRLLVTGMTILHQGNTFQKMTDPGLTLDTKLIAVYRDGNLYFRTFKAVNSIIDISDYFTEATDGEIAQVLEHPRLYVEDSETIFKFTDGWMRRRYTAVLASGVLDNVTPRKMKNRANKYGIALNTRRVDNADALVFPSTKKEIKTLLTFLNEGFFEGELTGKLWQTNSQRSVATPNNQTE